MVPILSCFMVMEGSIFLLVQASLCPGLCTCRTLEAFMQWPISEVAGEFEDVVLLVKKYYVRKNSTPLQVQV